MDKCIKQCRVQVNDKLLIIKMMKEVNPPRFRKRIAGLLSSGTPAQQSCRLDVSLWKSLLRQETQIEHSAQLTLALANSPYSDNAYLRARNTFHIDNSAPSSRIKQSQRHKKGTRNSYPRRNKSNSYSKCLASTSANEKRRSSRAPKPKKEPRKCHNCGKQGRLARDYRSRPKPSSSSTPTSSTRPPSKWPRQQTVRGTRAAP